MLKLEIDFLVIAGIGLGNRWQDVSASAGHAAGVDIAHVNQSANIDICVDGIDQKVGVVEQKLIVWPVSNYCDCNRAIKIFVFVALVIQECYLEYPEYVWRSQSCIRHTHPIWPMILKRCAI